MCVVGANVWRELFGAEAQLDDAITVDKVAVDGGRRAEEQAALGGGGDGPWMWNSKCWCRSTTFDAVFDNAHAVDSIFVRLGDGQAPLPARHDAARKAIESTLLRRHYGVQNFKVDRGGEEAQAGAA